MYLASNAFITAYLESDYFGKAIFIALLALSVLSWTLIVYKTWVTRTVRARSRHFAAVFASHKQIPLSVPYIPEAASGEMPNAFFEIYQILKRNTVEILKKNQAAGGATKNSFLSANDIDLVESHLQTGISQQAQRLEQYLFLLPTASSIGPLLGLLGTVWGILLSFSHMQSASSAMGNQAVLSGLAMALTTTVLGLVVAIPAFIGYMTLRNQISVFTLEMEDFSSDLLGALDLHYRRVDTNA